MSMTSSENERERRAPGGLPGIWCDRAAQLRRWGAEGPARAFEEAAAELEAALRAAADEALTLAEAAAESGYSERRLRELIHDGELPQAGQRGRPRVRRADLPRKSGRRSAGAYDPVADARELLRKGIR